MENDAAPSPIQPPSSSKKKKSKKEKKRKNDEVLANGSTPTSGSGKKKTKKNKRKKEEQVNDNSGSVDNNSGPSSPEQQQQQQQQQDASQTNNSQEQSPPPTAQISQQPATTTSNGPTGSIFNLSSSAADPNPSSSSSSNNNKSSPYQMKTIQGSVALLPTSLPNVTKCIQSLLHSLLLMYDANMGGVLLSLDEEQGVKLLPINIRRGNNITTNNRGCGNNNNSSSNLIGGRIVDDLPYIHYHFQVKGLLFCPTVGRKLKGQVVECTPTYVTLTTHHILSTKISTEKLQEQGFFYNSMTLEWTRERDVSGVGGGGGVGGDDDFLVGPSTSIYLDDIVEFVVERIHECGGYISLDGTQPSVSTLG